MPTDGDAVRTGWGTAARRAIGDNTPDELDQMDFAAGSMGPMVEAARTFVRRTRDMAGFGALQDAGASRLARPESGWRTGQTGSADARQPTLPDPLFP